MVYKQTPQKAVLTVAKKPENIDPIAGPFNCTKFCVLMPSIVVLNRWDFQISNDALEIPAGVLKSVACDWLKPYSYKYQTKSASREFF